MAAIINGTAWADTLAGSVENDTLYGNDGADWILGGSGNDALYGEAGRDTLDGGTGGDSLFGGTGDDALLYDPADLILRGNDGADLLYAAPLISSATISLANFSDIENLVAAGSDVTLTGNAADNILVGQGPGSSIDGASGNDLLCAAGSTGTLNGGLGNDILVYNPQHNPANVLGGAGQDKLDASRTETGVAIALADYTHNDIEIVIGGYGADTLSGNALANTLLGGAENDKIDGLGGKDSLYGGSGNDTLMYYTGLAYANGGSGNDLLTAQAAPAGVLVNLTAGTMYSGIEMVVGSAFNDTLTGSADGNDTLDGSGGNDLLVSSAGAETFRIGTQPGNDTLRGIDGNDWISFGEGWTSDNLYAYKTAGNELVIICSDSQDVVTIEDYDFSGGVSPHFIQADGTEILPAEIAPGYYSFGGLDHNFATINADNISAANDSGVLLHGLAGNDTITGGAGNDTLYGDYGNDSLMGGRTNDSAQGNNLLYGGAGADTLIAGSGSDTLYGDTGQDDYTLWNGCGEAIIASSAANNQDRLVIQESERSFMGITFNNFFINTTDDQGDHCPEALMAGNDLWLDFSIYGTVVLNNYAAGSGYQLNSVEIHNDVGGGFSFEGVLGIGSAANDSIQLADETDHLYFGMDGDDSIVGGNRQNYLVGGTGNDTLSSIANSKRNILLGGDGNDSLVGASSIGAFDILVGGDGSDTLAGGASGYDVYRFASGWGQDVIVDTVSTTINNCIDFTDLKLSDIAVVTSGTTMTITYGDDVLQITGGYENYAFRFGIAENGFNKYIYSNGTFNGM
ncbi:MAG: hypothetical protein H6Q66_42 [Firmicutes bacterium]|nr:hypothetical protein [Bacillota bacterium]